MPSKGLKGQKRVQHWFDAADLAVVRMRSTLAALQEAGYFRLNTDNAFTKHGAANCQPELFRLDPGKSKGLHCNIPICIWDCCRDLIRDHRLVRAALVTNPIKLVYIETSRFIPAVDEFGDLVNLRELYQKEILKAQMMCYAHSMKAANALWGAIWRVGIEPYAHLPAVDNWLITMRIVAALNEDAELTLLPRGYKIANYSRPNENGITRLMARLHAYPDGFMFGDPKLAAYALNQREGLRLSFLTGGFRNLEPMLRAPEKEEEHGCA